LEEYAVERRRHAPGRTDPVAVHVATCEACQARLRSIEEETGLLMEIFASASPGAPGGDPSIGSEGSAHLTQESLALYLDDALDANERDRIEDHLAFCSDCRGTLVDVYRETHIILKHENLGELEAGAVEATVSIASAKTERSADSELPEHDAQAGVENPPEVRAEPEERKQRYSSSSS
jgi:anti-sigma factor RsiW